VTPAGTVILITENACRVGKTIEGLIYM